MKNVFYKIYQLKEISECEYAFMPWKFAKNKFNLGDYDCVYKSNSHIYDCKNDISRLERIFYIFNMEIPFGFVGPSLSVSDIVQISADDCNSFYYCDFIGWKDITNIVKGGDIHD